MGYYKLNNIKENKINQKSESFKKTRTEMTLAMEGENNEN